MENLIIIMNKHQVLDVLILKENENFLFQINMAEKGKLNIMNRILKDFDCKNKEIDFDETYIYDDVRYTTNQQLK